MSSHISWVWSLEEKKTACTLHLLKDFTVYHQSKYIYTQNHACSYHTCTQKDLQAQNDLAKITNTSISNSHIVMSSIFWNLNFFLNVQYPQDLHIRFNCQILKLSHFTSKANRNEFINSNNHVWIFSWYFTNFILSSLGRIGVLLSNINFNKAKLLCLI